MIPFHRALPPVLGRFAEAHLRDRASRAVYVVVAGGRNRAWTAAEVVRVAGLADHEVGAALRRFLHAGVLEAVTVEASRPPRYRWNPAMGYLVDGEADVPTGEIDPVCGMPVPATSGHSVTLDHGAVVRFCSRPCLSRFEVEERRHPGREPTG